MDGELRLGSSETAVEYLDGLVNGAAATQGVWLVTATILVLFMQAGFLLVEAGSVRSKNTINVSQKNVADLIICGCAFLLVGGPLMFGVDAVGLAGFGGFSLDDSGTALQFLYQFAFCATAATIVSGAVAERMTFKAYLAVALLMGVLIYPAFGHLVWGAALIPDNAAWLADRGFLDYAGSTVVHAIGGWAALAAVLVIGPRLGRFDANGKVVPMAGHSSVLALAGVMILVIGWLGFNTGGARPGSDAFATIALNTVAAMVFGGAAGLVHDMVRNDGHLRTRTSVTGIVGGLVAITAGCAYVDFAGAIAIGMIGGLLATVAADWLLHRFRVDDPVDAIATHGIAGLAGTLLVALFARPEHLAGGSRLEQLLIQAEGSAIAFAWAFGVTYAAMVLMRRAGLKLRVTPAEEKLGLNLSEHGENFDVEAFSALMGKDADLDIGLADETIDDGGTPDAAGQIRAIDRVVRKANSEISYLALHDHLTGLKNRAAFEDKAEGLLSTAPAAIVGSVDLDGFKAINDSYGHHAGDALLKHVAKGLTAVLGPDALVARYGGDEFVWIVPVADGPETAALVAGEIGDALIRTLCRPAIIDGRELPVGASVGLALSPAHGSRRADLVRLSDMALYEAKRAGRRQWMMFDPVMEEKARRRKQLEHDMPNAIEGGEFFIEYQPQVDVMERGLNGFEALVRWQHPQFGRVAPNDFIEVAEETGLICELGAWVLRQACETAVNWPLVRGKPCLISVNVSPVQLLKQDVPALVRQVLAETGLEPGRLELELTEGALVHDPDEVARILTEVRSIGVRVAVDDFGTGYSSLSYLQRFPLDRLKVDRAFIRNIAEGKNDRSVIEAIINLGKTLGLNVIAEGVETEDQHHLLGLLGCDDIQGFLHSPPVSAARTLQLIVAANNRATPAAPAAPVAKASA